MKDKQPCTFRRHDSITLVCESCDNHRVILIDPKRRDRVIEELLGQ